MHCPKLAAAEGGRKWYPFDKGDNLYVHRIVSTGKQPDRGCEVYCVGDMSDDIVSAVPVLVDHQADVTSRLWEVEDEELPTSVKGRLRNHIDFWREELQAPAYVLSIIESGYVLPLKSEPTHFVKKNQVSAIKHSKFVQHSIKELLATKCIKEVPEVPHVCNPLSVVVNSGGKKRLVINLRQKLQLYVVYLSRLICLARFVPSNWPVL